MAEDVNTGDFLSFLKVLRKLLGIPDADGALKQLGEQLAIVRTNTEQIIMSQTKAQADAAQLRTDLTSLSEAVTTYTSNVRKELDAAKADAQAAHAEVDALKQAAADTSGTVPPEVQEAIDATHAAVTQLVSSLTTVDTAVATEPVTGNVVTTEGDAEGQARA